RAAARRKIESAQARIRAGEDFAKVAREVSEDATAGKGGDLGFFEHSVMVPAFDQAVFSMQKGEISDIIETRFGYHLIRLTDIRKASETPFEEVRDKLADEIRAARAAEEAYNLSRDLDDALGMEDSLKAAAESLNLSVREIGPVSRDEALADKLLSDPSLRTQVFATMPGQPVEITELENGHFVAVEVLQRIEPDVLPYTKVAARVYEDARQEKATQLARELADKMLAEASGATLDALAQTHGQPKYIARPVRSNGTGDDASWLTQDVLNAAFRTAGGQWVDRVLEVPQGFAVVQVQRVIAPSGEEYAGKRDEIAGEVKRARGAVRFARWMASIRDRHEIVINQKALERF
ncbi:MAG: peptidylprolyl isomerase, partial [Mariprofundaceae bacterium]|nr:peptidylprolyl isomerase [Mariprofundaceae bacterium]